MLYIFIYHISMKHWHKSTGKIIYDPSRPKMKGGKKKFNINDRVKWWCVVDIDKEITRYFRWHLVKNVPGLVLHKPAWDAHISVIRGEDPYDKNLWKKYHNEKINFFYDINIKKEGHFWLVKVYCPFLKEIRKEMKKPSDWDFHITIGRTWPCDYKKMW